MIPYEELISGRARTFFSKASPMAVKANGRFIKEVRTLLQTAKCTQRARFDNAIFKADGRVAKANGRFLKDCYFYARLRRRPEKPIRALESRSDIAPRKQFINGRAAVRSRTCKANSRFVKEMQLCQGSGTATLDSVADSKFHMIPYEELISGPVCNFIKADGQTARASGRFMKAGHL